MDFQQFRKVIAALPMWVDQLAHGAVPNQDIGLSPTVPVGLSRS